VKPVRVALTLLGLLIATPAFAQEPSFTPAQLIGLVAPVALYSDPLLAQVLAAATFYDQLPDAAHWADLHRNLTDVALANAMRGAEVPGNPTVAALLPFPEVLNKMVSDADWTRKLGGAFLAQQLDVLKAVQAERVKAKDFSYLRSNQHIAVGSAPDITIVPTNLAEIFVPNYDPAVVFSTPSPGLQLADAIRFDKHVSVGGFRLSDWHFEKFQVIGGYFQAWRWGLGGIDWPAQKVIINGAAWERNLANRREYVHRYPALQRIPPAERLHCGNHA
jgi:hypothetical protein